MKENLSSSDRSAGLIKALRSLQFCRDFELHLMIERLNCALKFPHTLTLQPKEKVSDGGPGGKSGRLVVQADGARGRGSDASKDEAADGWWGSCLPCINSHPGAQTEKRGKSDAFHFFCSGTQCMHKQCSLFRSHYILLFMSRQELRYRITDSLRLEEYIHCDRDGTAARVRIPTALHAGRALSWSKEPELFRLAFSQMSF